MSVSFSSVAILLLSSTLQMGSASSNKEKRAYFHPAIVASIRDCFFNGARGSLADKHEASFTSSIAEGSGKDERELPIAMVSLIATSVSHLSLSDLRHAHTSEFIGSCFP